MGNVVEFLLSEHQIVEYEGKLKGPRIIRRQNCMRCSSVLALELTDKMGFGGEYYVVKDCLWIRGLPDILYEKKRWFGNLIRCPICGNVGKLPMDKPLSYENMQQRKEGTNATT